MELFGKNVEKGLYTPTEGHPPKKGWFLAFFPPQNITNSISTNINHILVLCFIPFSSLPPFAKPKTPRFSTLLAYSLPPEERCEGSRHQEDPGESVAQGDGQQILHEEITP